MYTLWRRILDDRWFRISIAALIGCFVLHHWLAKFAAPPPVGLYIAVLGGLAAFVTLRKEPSTSEKAVYIVAITLLMVFEITNLYKEADRQRAEGQKVSDALDKTNQGLKTTLAGLQGVVQQINGVSSTLKTNGDTSQKQFHLTMNAATGTFQKLVSNGENDTRRFSELLSHQNDLFQEEIKMLALLSGSLLPAKDDSPSNACTRWRTVTPKDIVLLAGSNTYVVTEFPFVVVQLKNRNTVQLDKRSDGSLFLRIDMRDESNKVIFQMDENGIIRNGDIFMLRPDQSTAIFKNAFGSEIFRVRYLNPNTFQVTGNIYSGGVSATFDDIGKLHMGGNCIVGGKVGIRVE